MKPLKICQVVVKMGCKAIPSHLALLEKFSLSSSFVTFTYTFTYLLHAKWRIRLRNCRQTVLSAAAVNTSLQRLHLALSFPFSAVLLHVVLGLPRLRRPSGAHVIAVRQSLSYPFLIMCLMSFHLLLLISSLRFSIWAVSSTSFDVCNSR